MVTRVGLDQLTHVGSVPNAPVPEPADADPHPAKAPNPIKDPTRRNTSLHPGGWISFESLGPNLLIFAVLEWDG